MAIVNYLEFPLGFVSWGMTPEGRLDYVRLLRSPPLESPTTESTAAQEAHHRFASELETFLLGKETAWTVEPAWRGSDFFQKVWKALLAEVPRGRTVTYGELAVLAGSPRASRAVGTAMASNPWPLVVPCHRVLASNGPGGYFGGLDWKAYLLDLEGIRLAL